MCGITGWIGLTGSEQLLRSMTDVLSHRGPDGEGQRILPVGCGLSAGLGHRRLSIIDLATGDQPMFSHDGRFAIVFNGEIYNYLELRDDLRARNAFFQTSSDTEVILEAWRIWGSACLTKFRGMFAFALYDQADGSVVLARDPFGKKPLFYSVVPQGVGEGIVFGSEILALLKHPAVPADLDLESVQDYLCWRYVPGPNTFFNGIKKLRPGCAIHWKGGAWKEMRYWVPPEAEGGGRLPVTADPIEGFLDVFDESVKLRMRADVPIGAFLSSGLDSTSIVATLVHLGITNVRTFSVGFQGDTAAELPAAAETAKLLGTIHTPVELVSDHLTNLMPQLSRHRGAPMSDTADLPIYLMSCEAARHVKVVLSGEGADELFGGYPKHLVEATLGRLAGSELVAQTGHAMVAIGKVLPGRAQRVSIAGRALRERRFEDRMVAWFGVMSAAERSKFWQGPLGRRAPDRHPFEAAAQASALRRVLHFDQTSWLPDNLLERMDSMTMAASIEGRAPFMDIRLAEYAASMPETWRIRGRTTKRIVREALRQRIPQAVLNRRKIGFRMPVSAWFRGPLREPFHDLLLDSGAVTGGLLDQEALRRMFDEHSTGQADHSKALWALYALETFLREFF
jgi:asparagine synthase (glutamine-hydrolysing)